MQLEVASAQACVLLVRSAALSLVLLVPVAASQVIPRPPQFDKSLNAGNHISAHAQFGRSFTMGNFDTSLAPAADAMICAQREDVAGFEALGAGYPFQAPSLNQLPTVAQLLPPAPEDHLTMGELDVAIGNVLGGTEHNRVFFAAPHLGPNNAGAIEVFDMTAIDPTVPVITIHPPGDPSLPHSLPARLFGHSFAIADVDGDGTNDLVVGAAFTLEPAGDDTQEPHGRVYVFFGHAHFFDAAYPGMMDPPGYLYRWIAIRAPQVDSILIPPPTRFPIGGGFGLSVDAADLNGDNKAEILVGRAERDMAKGRAHLFHGLYIKTWIDSHPIPLFDGLLITPPAAPDMDHGVAGYYETLRDTTNNETRFTTFGWNVFMLRMDVGKPGAVAGLDGKPDIAVYSEAADWLGTTPPTPETGALIVFFNDSASVSGSLVDEAGGVKLQAPVVPQGSGAIVDGPHSFAHFGFCAAAISWASTEGGSSVNKPYLLIGEPDVMVSNKAMAGRTFMFQAPIGPNSGQGGHPNALTFPLVDPLGVQVRGHFGGWIAVGDYVQTAEHPGEECIIGAWGKDLVNPGNPTAGLQVEAGQAYSFFAVVLP